MIILKLAAYGVVCLICGVTHLRGRKLSNLLRLAGDNSIGVPCTLSTNPVRHFDAD